MICTRCNKKFDSSIPEKNVETYGDDVYYACPHCGKLHRFHRIIRIETEDVSDMELYGSLDEADDWCRPVVKDCDYNKADTDD